MYSKGLDAAVIIGVLAALPPVVWLAWWFFASLGERVSGRPRRPAV